MSPGSAFTTRDLLSFLRDIARRATPGKTTPPIVPWGPEMPSAARRRAEEGIAQAQAQVEAKSTQGGLFAPVFDWFQTDVKPSLARAGIYVGLAVLVIVGLLFVALGAGVGRRIP